MKKSSLLIYLITIIMMLTSACKSENIRLFLGKYTEAGEKGFYVFDLNPGKGIFKVLSEGDAGPNPSYFCISNKTGLIYAANEEMHFKGVKGGGITTLKYDPKSGVTEKISDLAVPNGGPCFISLSPANDFLLMANYSGGSVAVVKLDGNGIPETVTDTIMFKGEAGTESHAHMVSFDPSGKRVYVTDLGLDQIVTFTLDVTTGRLQQINNGIAKLPKGSGPRHFVFNSECTKMYVISELNSTVTVFDVDVNGELKAIQTITSLSEGFKGESFCADIHIGKDGHFLYGSNRGENSIVTFSIAPDGTLKHAASTPCGGNWPRNFVIDPSGKFLIVGNEKSGNISLFTIDEKTGIPVATGKEFKISNPSCLKF
jgi:6-phosphogluconolactonase